MPNLRTVQYTVRERVVWRRRAIVEVASVCFQPNGAPAGMRKGSRLSLRCFVALFRTFECDPLPTGGLSANPTSRTSNRAAPESGSRYFIPSNVFCSNARSLGLPSFSRVESMHFTKKVGIKTDELRVRVGFSIVDHAAGRAEWRERKAFRPPLRRKSCTEIDR